MKLSDFQDRLVRWLPRIMLLLCLLQPCLDVLSYWQDALGMSNGLTTVLRFAMLAAVVLLGFALSERRRYYVGLAGLLLILTAGHVLACSQWGYDALTADLANLLRIYQLPLMTLAFLTFLRRSPETVSAMERGFFGSLLLCAAVEILSVITGTNPYTYPDKKVGILGWFYFANSQSAILSMLVPVALIRAWKSEKKWLFPAMAAVSFAVLYGFATRLAYMALIGVFAAMAVCLFLLGRMRAVEWKRSAAVLLALSVLAAAGYGISPMTKNAQLVARNKVLKQQDIIEKVAADEKEALAEGLKGDALAAARLENAYETYLTGPTGRFGLERTAEWYDYSTDAGDIADVRREKLTYNRMLLEDNPGLSLWFGLEREDLTYDGESYDAENDFHGIYYLCGAVGLGLLVVFLGFFLLRIALALVRDFRGTLTPEAVGCGLALICGLAHAYFTAGVLRRPNATFYLAALLAMAFVLSDRKRVETPQC